MFEKEAEEYADNQIGCDDGYYEWTDVTQAFQKGAEFGYEQGIGRLRYCCTCKHYMRKCWDKTEPYGICADWEIKEK